MSSLILNKAFIVCSSKEPQSSKKKQKVVFDKNVHDQRLQQVSTRLKTYRNKDKEFIKSRSKEIQSMFKDFCVTDFMILRDIINEKINAESDAQDETENASEYNLVRSEYIRDTFSRDE